jgi:ATP-binding cassette, subfamily B, bacterial
VRTDEATRTEDPDRAARRAGWRLIRTTVRPQRTWMVAGIGAGLTWTAARVSIPLLVAAAIDRGILASDTGTTFRFVGLVVVVGVIQALSTSTRRYSAFRLALRTETNLRDRLFTHLQRLHFAFHDRAQTGQLMARANTDIQQVNTVVILLPLTIASMLTLLAVIIVMLSQSVSLTFLALGALPLLNLAAARFSRRIGPVVMALQQRLGDLSGVVEESISGVRVVKGFGAEPLVVGRLEREADRVYDRALAAVRLRAGFIPLVDLLPMVAMVAILWWGGHLVLDGQLELGYLVAFNSYVVMLIWPLRMAGMLIAQASRSAASAGRIDEILATEPAIVDRPDAGALPEGPGEVRFEGVTFGYGGGASVLDEIDLVASGGEAVALVGATGPGKSTVARLVARFYDVDAGRVLVDGVDVREVSLEALRRSVGLVFEDTFLFSGTVRDNIAFAEPDAPLDRVQRAARSAGADAFIEALPDAYDTVIGEQGFSLSGGQRQRIAIARAVIAEPRILILDDATSSVDPTK